MKSRVLPSASLIARRVAIAVLLVFSLCVSTPRANAMTDNTRVLIRGGTYGLLGGTLVGIAVLPLTGSARGVFIGSSLGLYVGLLMGVYHITHRDDPGNPFRGELGDPQGEPERFALESASPMKTPSRPLMDVSVPILSF